MAPDFQAWRLQQSLPVRIASSRAWSAIAAIFTPADKLESRVCAMYLDEIFRRPIDEREDNVPRWFEVLSLGFLKRKWRRPVRPSAST